MSVQLRTIQVVAADHIETNGRRNKCGPEAESVRLIYSPRQQSYFKFNWRRRRASEIATIIGDVGQIGPGYVPLAAHDRLLQLAYAMR